MSVELAMKAAEKLLTDRLTGAEGGRLIDQSIEEIPSKLQ
jgi:F0F1-type ATP synthase membrane subunit b/b'